jgi:hypothetical protein
MFADQSNQDLWGQAVRIATVLLSQDTTVHTSGLDHRIISSNPDTPTLTGSDVSLLIDIQADATILARLVLQLDSRGVTIQ